MEFDIKLKSIKVSYLDGFNLSHLESIELKDNTIINNVSGIPKIINLNDFRTIIGVLQSLIYPNSDRLNYIIENKNEISFIFSINNQELKYSIVTDSGRIEKESYFIDEYLIYEYIREDSIYFRREFYSDSYKEKIIKNGNISSLLNNLGSCYPSNEYYFFSLISYIKSIRSIYINFDKYIWEDSEGILNWEKYIGDNNLIPQLQEIVKEHFGECSIRYIDNWTYSKIIINFKDNNRYNLKNLITDNLEREIRKIIIKDMLSKENISLFIIDKPVDIVREPFTFYNDLKDYNTQIVFPIL